MKINSLLDNAERLYEGKLDAPENILERNGVLYVGLRTNTVVKIIDDDIKVLVDFGTSCCKFSFGESLNVILLNNNFTLSDNVDQYKKAPCGRPLGMAFDTLGDNLIVIHSYDGVYEVDLKNGNKKLLVSRKDIIGKEVRNL